MDTSTVSNTSSVLLANRDDVTKIAKELHRHGGSIRTRVDLELIENSIMLVLDFPSISASVQFYNKILNDEKMETEDVSDATKDIEDSSLRWYAPAGVLTFENEEESKPTLWQKIKKFFI